MPIDDVHTMIYIIVYNDIHHCIQWYTAIPLYHCIQLYIIVYSCISYNTAVYHTIYSYPIVSLYDIQLYTMIAMIYSCIQGQLCIIACTRYNGIAVYRISLYTDVFDLRCIRSSMLIIVYRYISLHAYSYPIVRCACNDIHHCIQWYTAIQLYHCRQLYIIACASLYTPVSPLHHTQWYTAIP